MVKRLLILLLLLPLLVLPAYGAGTGVYDLSGLFTQEQISEMTNIVSSLQRAHQIDVLMVTTDDTQGMSTREYADRFILSMVGTDEDAILQLFDMQNREVYISTSGRAIDIFTDARIEMVLDAVIDGGMVDGDYSNAAIAGLSAMSGFMSAGVPADGYREEEAGPNELSAGEVAAGVGGGGALGATHFLNNRRKYKTKTKPKSFALRSNGLLSLAVANDQLMDTRVSVRAIPVVQPSSSSGGGGGRSTTHRTGGGTFGGGGRKF